jgi:hypothetical protein
MSAQRSAGDWLDANCWRCGSQCIAPSKDGRLLCRPCRLEVFSDQATSESPLKAIRRIYWEAHALKHCWRCMERPVDPDDDLGLCPSCL